MPMRLSGLMSGMDTESIIQQLVEAKKTKVTKAVKAQKSLKYKQDAWKDMNKQILSLYNKTLSNMRFQSSFVKKVTKVSNSSVVSVITGEGAMNSVQNLEVDNLAKSGYLTGGKLGVYKLDESGNPTKEYAEGKAYALDEDGNPTGKLEDITGKTTLKQLGLDIGDGAEGTLQVKIGNEVGFITVDGNSTVENFVQALRTAGVNANFDETNQRIFVSSKSSGKDNNFEITALDGGGFAAMNTLRLSYDKDGQNTIKDTIDALRKKYDNIKKWEDDLGESEAKRRIDAEALRLTATWMDLEGTKGELSNYMPAIQKYLDGKGITLDDNFDYDSLDADKKKLVDDAVAHAIDDAKLRATTAEQDVKKAAEEIEAAIAAGDDTAKAAAEQKKADAEAELASAKEDIGALGTWVSDWRKNYSARKDLDSKITVSTNPDNSTKIDLNAAEQQKIKDQVAAEIENAKEELKKLDAYEALTDAEKAALSGQKQDAEDAKIKLNGVEYTSSKNTFEINGITLTVNAKPPAGEVVTITTEDDTSGVYDMVKNFIKEYNTLINQMDKMYNAESSKGYDPLTDEEKEAMSDSAIEEWEKKITDSILRKDSVLGTFANELKTIMMEGVEVNGTKMYLSNFGIGTLNYFLAAENEKSAYHIDGDPDDTNTSGNPDKLKSMIANEPETVMSFFTQLSQKMYDKMFELMKSKEGYSSSLCAYDDIKMKSDYEDYDVKIKELEKKLADYEDKWYAKFAAMETALAKMQNNASAVTSLLGG